MDIKQLENAIGIALQGTGDPGLRKQAIGYCNEVRDSADGWQAGLAIVAEPEKRLPEAVFFGYQVLDAALPRLGASELNIVRTKLWELVNTLVQKDGPSLPSHTRNKLAQTLAYLFVLLYQSTWSTFFTDLQQIAVSNAKATDLYLRVLKAVHEEIGDALIIREPEVTQRNSALKDQIRAQDMTQLVLSLGSILHEYSETDMEIVEGALQVTGGWVSWIEISLIVGNARLVELIFKQLSNPQVRIAACATIGEIISKKMPPENKLELIMLLNLTQLLRELPTAAGDITFDERVAHLANIVGSELCRIMDRDEINEGVRAKAEELLVELMPVIVGYLRNEYDDTSMQVIPCINDYLQYVRKDTKRRQAQFDTSKLTKNNFGQFVDFPPPANFIPESRRLLLKHLLSNIVAKSVYDDEAEWAGQDDEDEAEFQQLRSKLKVLQEQIATIDVDLFIDDVAQFVTAKLSGLREQPWQQTELGLYEIAAFGDILKGGVGRAVRGAESRAQQVLYELFRAMVCSEVVQTAHGAVQLWYMELVHRHSGFFTNDNCDLLFKTLEVFLSPLGVHNRDPSVRVRSWYLLFRVVKTVRRLLDSSSDIAPQILRSVMPLLRIEVQLPTPVDESSDDESNANAEFDAQLYLFELCGMLSEQAGPEATELLRALFGDIEQAVSSAKQGRQAGNTEVAELAYLRAHHDIMALGTFARGISDVIGADRGQKGEFATLSEMRSAAGAVAAVVEVLYDVPQVREACRHAISRLVGLMGSQIIMEVSRLVNALLTHSERPEEVGDLLSFLGQLVHVFRTDATVFDMFTSLIAPLLEQVFSRLQSTAAEAQSGSTDAQVARKELVRLYLAFINNVLANRYGAVFLVGQNLAAFESVMESLIHYSQTAENDVSNQRQAVIALAKIVQLWGSGQVAADNFGEGEPVALFQADFVYEKLTELCWTLTTKPGFSLKDAQTRLAVLELGGLQKACYEAAGTRYVDVVAKYLRAAGLASPLVDEFVNQLANATIKDFKRYFYDFLVRTAS